MATCTREEFVDRLEESGLLSAEDIARAREEFQRASLAGAGGFPPGGAALSVDLAAETAAAMKLAKRYVKEGLLNRWQAQALLSGVSIKLGKYTLLEQIAAGEMGAVYRARHASLDREVALKTLSRQYTNDSVAVGEFLRDARAIAALDHRNLVHLFDICQENDRYFLVLEHVLGADVERLVSERGALPAPKAADILRQTADGLSCIHEAGLAHGHLQAADLIVEPQGVVKIVGLGAGQLIDETRQSLSAPELPAGAAPTAAADMFALGCVAWRMLTGKPAPSEMVARGNRDGSAVRASAAELAKLRPDAPVVLIDLACELLAGDPSFRPMAGDVSRRLTPWLREQIKEQKKESSSANLPKVKKLPTAKALPADEAQTSSHSEVATANGEPLAEPIVTLAAPTTNAASGGPTTNAAPGGLPISIVTANRTPAGDAKERVAAAEKIASPAKIAASEPTAPGKAAPPNRKLVLAIAGGVLASVVLLGIAVAAIGMFVFGGGKDAQVDGGDRLLSAQTRSANETESKSSSVVPSSEFSGSEEGQAPAGDRAVAPVAGDPLQSFAQALNAAQAEANRDNTGGAASAAPAQPESAAAVEQPTPAPASASAPTETPSVAEAAPAAPAAETPPAETPVVETPPPAAVETPPPPADAAAANPLRDLPVAVDLPPIDNSGEAPQPVVWGAVHHGESDDFFAQLFGAENAVGAAKLTATFYAKAGSGGVSTRDWEIFVRYKNDDDGRAIARVQVAEGVLSFAWTPQAAKEPPAGFLKNCVFHLRTAGAEHSIALRKPLIVPPLLVSFDKRAKTAHFELPDAPRAEAVRVEIDALEGEFGETHFEPGKELSAKKGETSLLIGAASEPLFKLAIESGFTRRFELSQTPLFHNKVGDSIPINPSTVKKREGDLIGGLQQLKFYKQRYDLVTEVGERARMQEEITNNDKQLALAETRVKQFADFKDVAEKLNNSGKIHFRLYLPTGSTQLELARSSSDAAPGGK